eukprot:COSAG02_NODE_18311_length_942_cov_1.553719_1_plen_81_part_10
MFADATLRGALSQQQRLKELQARAFATMGSALVAVFIGCSLSLSLFLSLCLLVRLPPSVTLYPTLVPYTTHYPHETARSEI